MTRNKVKYGQVVGSLFGLFHMLDRTIRNNIYQLFISSISRLLTLFLVGFLYCIVAQAREAESSAVVARIGDTFITRTQLDAENDEELWEDRQSLYESRVEYLNKMADKALLYQEARARGISVEQLLKLELDLDMAEFKHCIVQNNREFRDNYPAGPGDIELNISGTPTYFINGLKHTGLLSAGELASLIEREQYSNVIFLSSWQWKFMFAGYIISGYVIQGSHQPGEL